MWYQNLSFPQILSTFQYYRMLGIFLINSEDDNKCIWRLRYLGVSCICILCEIWRADDVWLLISQNLWRFIIIIIICFGSSPQVFMCRACLEEIFRDDTTEDTIVVSKTTNFNQSFSFSTLCIRTVFSFHTFIFWVFIFL